MDNQNFIPEPEKELEAEPLELDDSDFVETDIPCPRCLEERGQENHLFSTQVGESPDDFVKYLYCRICRYSEKE